jgi:hypothetical protein
MAEELPCRNCASISVVYHDKSNDDAAVMCAALACFSPPAASSGNCWSVRRSGLDWSPQDVNANPALARNFT